MLFLISDKSSANLAIKAKFCVEILELLRSLDAGECTLKKLIDCELHKCRQELLRRLSLGEYKETIEQF